MAQGNSKGKDIVESEICNCTICLEVFKSPKYLPCLHTYCEACLHDYIVSTTSNEESPEGVFFCPVCRAEVQVPDPSAPKEEWAKLMPANHMINSLMDISIMKSEEDKQECDLCKFDGETICAEIWCFECKQYLCATCTKHHRRSMASRSHNPVPVGDTKPDQREVARDKVEEPCTVHKEEILKVYCIEHQKMCCVLCLSIDHRKCENIKTFDEMAEKMKENKETQKVADKLGEMASKMEQVCDRKIENIKSIEKQHQDIQERAEKLVEEAKTKLNICQQEFKENFQGIQKEQVTQLLEAKEKLQNFQKSVTNSQKMLTASAEYSSPKQAFITLEKIKERLQIQGQVFEALLKDDYDIFYDVTLNKQLISMTTNIKSIADVRILKKDVSNDSSPSLAESEMLPDSASDVEDIFSEVQVEPTDTSEAALQKQLKLTCIDDIEPLHMWDVSEGGLCTGGSFLLDGRLLVINNKLETMAVYDVNGRRDITYKLPFKPWDAVQHSDGNIFVSSRSSGTVVVYTLVDDMFLQMRNIDIDGVDGLNAVNVTTDLILAERKLKIRVVTMDGQTETICASSVQSPIATSSRDKTIFYHCQGENVVCRSVRGEEIFRHELQEIEAPRGIGFDCAGNIYVTGRDSKNIYLVSQDGGQGRVFMSSFERVVSPYALGFDGTGTKFFITDMENGTAAVYKLNVKNTPNKQ